MNEHSITVRLPRPWAREIGRVAVRSGCSESDVLLAAVEQFLNHHHTVAGLLPVEPIDDE